MKRLAIILSVCVATTVLAGCGDKKEKVAYRPVAFGENQQCYYVESPEEAIALQQQGLCDINWVPTPAPQHWRMMYFPYYSSPAYFNTYVPVATRTVYVERTRSYGEQNRSAIATAAKKATYRGSNGKQVPAEKIGATKYGAGNRFGPTGTKFGGGDRTAPATPATTPATSSPTPTPKATPKPKAPPAPKPNSSGGVKSGGYKPSGGGSKPSGGFGGGSRGVSGGKR